MLVILFVAVSTNHFAQYLVSLSRIQRRDCRVQEHFFHRLGCRWTGQDPSLVAPLYVSPSFPPCICVDVEELWRNDRFCLFTLFYMCEWKTLSLARKIVWAKGMAIFVSWIMWPAMTGTSGKGEKIRSRIETRAEWRQQRRIHGPDRL